jgi:hypothetical protein
LNATDANEELGILSTTLSSLSKENLYTAPQGYFENVIDEVLQKVRPVSEVSEADELESLSPMLFSLKKENPYSVPPGYFNTAIEIPEKKEGKVVSIISRKWFRYAAAAVVVAIASISAVLIINKKNIDPKDHPYAWVKKNVQKVDSKDLDAFVKLTEVNAPEAKDVVSTPVNTTEVKELMKDVSDKEIQDFLNEIPESATEADAAMN